ncbi:zinc finger protein 488 isoform X2 [Ambystoma mexicanum]|uniref:zinc finger protein 488 isoform X2 n=1 Tax=Ambystoma mexicanum TaxID=8296 RepID=UPI0037E7419E
MAEFGVGENVKFCDTMDLTSLPKLLWTSDSKFLQHHFPDIFATVYTTQEIPEGTIFGPCLFPYTFLDTIGFIALKCLDTRNIHYVFKVDAAGAANGPAGPAWMRLVQAANDSRDQNMEAYLKNSQLYFRSTRKIPKNAELLVWYDEALAHLLRFPEKKSILFQNGYRCPDCDQEFQREYPYLSHVRFLCVPEKNNLLYKNILDRKTCKSVAKKEPFNFHSLARDLEGKVSNKKADVGECGEGKSRPQDAEVIKSRKTVLSETTNQPSEGQCSVSRDDTAPENTLGSSTWKSTSRRHLYKRPFSWKEKESAFTEVQRTKDGLKQANEKEPILEGGPIDPDEEQGLRDLSERSSGSAFSLVWPLRARGDEKSAFSKPSKCESEGLLPDQFYPANESVQSLGDVLGVISASDVRYYGGNPCKSSIFGNDLCNSQLMMQTSLSRSQVFPYTAEPMSKTAGVQLPTSSSLALLPPTFTSLGVSAQNWCAKCNLSFRMTADLVFHMRSHHKKESALEAQFKRRREEKLTCPICHEYFKERHHLSRHMTSHN